MSLYTTLRLCREHRACRTQYQLLVAALGPDWADDRPIPLLRLLDLDAGKRWLGFSNALWALRAVPEDQAAERDFIARLFAVGCAEAVLPIHEAWNPGDLRLRFAVETACLFAWGLATREELAEAQTAADAAAEDAAYAFAYAAYGDADAAEDAADADAAEDAADAAADAATHAADAATHAAYGDADAAYAAEDAAYGDAYAAYAAEDATHAATYAATCAAAYGDAARRKMRAWQIALLRRLLAGEISRDNEVPA